MTLDRTQVNHLSAVSLGASTDRARPVLCGVFLEWQKTTEGIWLTACATDSYLLAIRRMLIEADSAWNPYGSVLIDAEWFRKGLMAKRSSSADVRLRPHQEDPGAETSGLSILFQDKKVEVETRLCPIDGRFPNYRELLGEYSDNSPKATFAVELINKAMKTSGGVRHVSLIGPANNDLAPRVWKTLESGPDPLEGPGWWCLQMPVRD